MVQSKKALEEKIRAIFSGCVLFQGLPAEACSELASRASLRTYKARDVIFLMATPGSSLFAVLAGKVRISVSSPDGKEITLATLQTGEIFGEIAVLDGRERTANATAINECQLAELERQDVLHFFDCHPSAWHRLVEMLCDRLRRTDQHLSEVALLPLPVRLSITMLRMAEVKQVDGRSLKLVQLSQREIGNLVGASRESINKLLHEWQRQNLIHVHDHGITITRSDLLERLSEGFTTKSSTRIQRRAV
ncbi:MAG: Crp/Fnr family transcriptional regulator [Xanthobacteraceae bacterium]